jgi:hypothetical protein
MIRETLRLRDSRVAELVVLAAAWVAGYGMLASSIQRGSTWYTPEACGHMTPVGYWYAVVSLPIFHFLLYRWLYRMVVWTRFLRALSTLDLELVPTHPDGAAGLGFLGKACIPFGGILFAVSAAVASTIATHVLFEGASLERFQVSYGALFALTLAIFGGPLLVFVPVLARVKRQGLAAYGTLASHYTQAFDRKWVQGDPPDEPLLGSADVQSLADLGNSYELIRKMRAAPIELRDVVAMAIPGVIPVIPLAATVMPLSEILKDLLRLLA